MLACYSSIINNLSQYCTITTGYYNVPIEVRLIVVYLVLGLGIKPLYLLSTG